MDEFLHITKDSPDYVVNKIFKNLYYVCIAKVIRRKEIKKLKKSFAEGCEIALQRLKTEDRTNQSNQSKECKICFDDIESIWILNCGHLPFCDNCSQQLLRDDPKCPICREKVTTRKRAYY